MNLELITKEWEKDSQIDDVLLDEASIRIPALHQKYLTYLNEFKILLRRKQRELKLKKHTKWLFYSGKASPEDYENKPLNHRILKSDIPRWVDVDEEIMRTESQLDQYEVILETLNEILRQIHQMSFNIKNAITWRQFVSGGS